MDPRMLVLDLDGTALTHDWQITDADAAAAARLQAAGIHVTIATGRLFAGTHEAAARLGVQGSVAVMNGTELVDVGSREVIYGQYVHDHHRHAIRDLLHGFGLAPILFGADRIHHDDRGAHLNDYLRTWTPDVHHHGDLHLDHWATERLVAVAATGDHDAVVQAAEAIAADYPELRPTKFTTWSGHGFLELRAHGDDKGTAIERLAAERHLDADQVVAVGDWLNDLPMLARAGRSFAMKGAAEAAIDAADHTLTAVRGEGGAVVELASRIWDL